MTSPQPSSDNDILTARWVPFTIPEVEALALRLFGQAGAAKRLSSERDETFRLSTEGRNFTLKISNPVEDPLSLSFQASVLLHLEATSPSVPVPRLVRTLDGQESFSLPVDGGNRIVRMLTYLEGEQLQTTASTPRQCGNLGRALGALSAGLSGAAARPPAGRLLWDLTHFLDLRPLVTFVAEDRRALVEGVLDDFAAVVLPVMDSLRLQVIHNDFNPFNILVDPDAPDEVTGIIDFGDMVYGPMVGDLAVAASYQVWADDWSAKLAAMLRGFSSIRRFQPAEIEVLPTLIAARLAMTLIITEWRATLRPDERDYILRNNRAARLGLVQLSRCPRSDLRQLIHDNCEG